MNWKRLLDGFTGVAYLASFVLLTMFGWSLAYSIVPLADDAQRTGNYGVIVAGLIMALVTLSVSWSLFEGGWKHLRRALLGKTVVQETLKLAFDTTELTKILDQFADQLIAFKQGLHPVEEGDEVPSIKSFDDSALEQFAAIMSAKMAIKRAQGWGGWQSTDALPSIEQAFGAQLTKEPFDAVDVANYAMMIWWHELHYPKAKSSSEEALTTADDAVQLP
jgi:hypothetical protein